jgi:hypothetical protein
MAMTRSTGVTAEKTTPTTKTKAKMVTNQVDIIV